MLRIRNPRRCVRQHVSRLSLINLMLYHPRMIQPEVSILALSRGKSTIVDTQDLPLLVGYSWYAHLCNRSGRWYAAASIRCRSGNGILFMHRLILDYPSNLIDHRDGDGLNNCRSNLREATRAQNGQNRGPQRNNSSGYKGVSWYKRRQLWQAQITASGVRKHLGFFSDIEEAAAAYAVAAKSLHGEFFRLK